MVCSGHAYDQIWTTPALAPASAAGADTLQRGSSALTRTTSTPDVGVGHGEAHVLQVLSRGLRSLRAASRPAIPASRRCEAYMAVGESMSTCLRAHRDMRPEVALLAHDIFRRAVEGAEQAKHAAGHGGTKAAVPGAVGGRAAGAVRGRAAGAAPPGAVLLSGVEGWAGFPPCGNHFYVPEISGANQRVNPCPR